MSRQIIFYWLSLTKGSMTYKYLLLYIRLSRLKYQHFLLGYLQIQIVLKYVSIYIRFCQFGLHCNKGLRIKQPYVSAQQDESPPTLILSSIGQGNNFRQFFRRVALPLPLAIRQCSLHRHSVQALLKPQKQLCLSARWQGKYAKEKCMNRLFFKAVNQLKKSFENFQQLNIAILGMEKC